MVGVPPEKNIVIVVNLNRYRCVGLGLQLGYMFLQIFDIVVTDSHHTSRIF